MLELDYGLAGMSALRLMRHDYTRRGSHRCLSTLQLAVPWEPAGPRPRSHTSSLLVTLNSSDAQLLLSSLQDAHLQKAFSSCQICGGLHSYALQLTS